MKPVWEEDWDASREDVCFESGVLIFVGTNHGEEGFARANLGAMAPRMARLLLRLEWEGTLEPDGQITCVECGAVGGPPHSPHCELDRILRDAGIREGESHERESGGVPET